MFLATLQLFDDHYNPDPLLTRCSRPHGFRLESESGSMRWNKEGDENYRSNAYR